MSSVEARVLEWAERGLIPDFLVRAGIRHLCARRLREVASGPCDLDHVPRRALLDAMAASPLALVPDQANAQHYEVPPPFFQQVLGPHLKYSACYWAPGIEELEMAERTALVTSAQRARISDGQAILELGCGWGSMTLHLARSFPGSRITAVSNSALQREHIEGVLRREGLTNVEVRTCDMNHLELPGKYDRVVSIEMFEHMRNYRLLMDRIHGWMNPGGLLFVHIFCHRRSAYTFEDRGSGDWMARHFFTGGLMPSEDLLWYHQGPFELVDRWAWSGTHYQRTAEAWLANLDRRREQVLEILEPLHGAQTPRWFHRWRLFFLACAETFGYRDGDEWRVAHYLFRA